MIDGEIELSAPPRRSLKGVVLASCIGLGLMLALAVRGAVSSWRLAGDVHMSIHGWIAMGTAGLFTALLAGGLINLAFYSARKGYDDAQVGGDALSLQGRLRDPPWDRSDSAARV